MTDHPSLERLSELAERELAADAAADVQRHVAGCVACRAAVHRLQTLREHARGLAPSIDPPPGTWAAIRLRIAADGRHGSSSGHRWGRGWGLRAAAALMLVAGSSTLTVVAMRWRDRAVADVPPPTGRATPAAVVAVERSYAGAVDELTATLETQRASLAPETVATLERTLRVIDDAIAEARAALAADPANDAIIDVLTANYEQKVQLLRRASELLART